MTPEEKAAYKAEKMKLKEAKAAEKAARKAAKANETPEDKVASIISRCASCPVVDLMLRVVMLQVTCWASSSWSRIAVGHYIDYLLGLS